jgi:hypothetical protein
MKYLICLVALSTALPTFPGYQGILKAAPTAFKPKPAFNSILHTDRNPITMKDPLLDNSFDENMVPFDGEKLLDDVRVVHEIFKNDDISHFPKLHSPKTQPNTVEELAANLARLQRNDPTTEIGKRRTEFDRHARSMMVTRGQKRPLVATGKDVARLNYPRKEPSFRN